MSQYLDKDGASRIAENFLLKQSEQDAILENLRFDLKKAEHALVKTIQGPAPLNIRALTRPLDDYVISGNTLQNGTPTPEDPADVVGCGVRTGNLIEFKNKTQTVRNVDITIQNGQLSFNGTANENGGRLFQVSEDIILESGTYRLSHIRNGIAPAYILQSKSDSGKYYLEGQEFRLTSKGTFYISFNFTAGTVYSGDLKVMLNAGSTALPYEPYGYKLPLTIGGTEYPIYLGEVQTTRRLKKIAFDGTEEGWEKSATRAGCFALRGFGTGVVEKAIYCTHATYVSTASQLTSNNTCYMGNDFNIWLDLFNAQTTNEQFKSYLAAQYAAGTPVTIWYVLAEPETAVVNEPLHKIGDYADTVSMAQAGVEISTTKGFNTITTDTTVLPSNIEVKGAINNA